MPVHITPPPPRSRILLAPWVRLPLPLSEWADSMMHPALLDIPASGQQELAGARYYGQACRLQCL
eukprot:2090704-Alexandrium_andersonii.AAC.1